MQTSEAVLVAAAELFAERGYDRSPLSDIAARAGVSTGIIIYHFKRKEHLLGELALRYLHGLRASCQKRMDQGASGLGGVFIYVSSFHDYIRENSQLSAAYFRNFPGERLKFDKDLGPRIAAAEQSLLVLLQSLLLLGVDHGAIRAQEVDSIARSIQAQLLGGAFMIFFQNGEARAIADDAVNCVHSLLSNIVLSDRQSEGSTPCLRI
jgi:TetR/AcrR family fatty acid metabolism transcriptional regulator